jgi:hypothetical protein
MQMLVVLMAESGLGYWLTPLSFLAGVGLIILSTATRSNALDAEIRILQQDAAIDPQERITLLRLFVRRAYCFRNALIALYLSFALLALGTLAGLLLEDFTWAETSMKLCVILGVAALLFAAMQLIWESRLGMQAMKRRCILPPSRSDSDLGEEEQQLSSASQSASV